MLHLTTMSKTSSPTMRDNISADNTSLDGYERDEKLLSSEGFMIVTIVLIISGCVGLLQNVVVIVIFARVRKLRSPTNMFIVSLSLCDVLMALLGIPFSAASSASGRWLFCQIGCILHGFIMSFLGYTSIFLLASISVERYLLITKSLSQPIVSTNRAMGAILVCWLFGFILSIPPLAGWSSYTFEGAMISCSVNWQSKHPLDVSYIVTVFTLCFFLPVGIIVFSYYNIFKAVHSFAHRRIWYTSSHVTKRKLKAEYRTTRNILLTIGAFLLCWTPYAVVSLWSAFGNPADISPVAGTIPAVIAKSAIVWNPMVYVLSNREFRSHIKTSFPCDVIPQCNRTKGGSTRSQNSGSKGRKSPEISENAAEGRYTTKMNDTPYAVTTLVLKSINKGSRHNNIGNGSSISEENNDTMNASACEHELLPTPTLEQSVT